MTRITQNRVGSFQPLLGLGSVCINGSSPNYRLPMLANPSPVLGDVVDFLGKFLQVLAEWLGGALSVLANIVKIPTDILSQGIDVAFSGLSSVVGMIPVLGPLLSEIVLLGGAIIGFAVTVPFLVLSELGNLLEGAAKWLDTKLTPDEKKETIEEEKKKIIEKAPDPIKDTVESLLNSAASGGSNTQAEVAARAAEGGALTGNVGTTDPSDPNWTPPTPEKSFIEKVAPVAAPVAAVGLLLAVVLT